MKFCSVEIPEALHALAREHMLQSASFTPAEIRNFLLREAADTLASITKIESNQWIVANNVFRTEIQKLASQNLYGQLKRGVWMRRDLLEAR